ncbi:hypothetical protein NKG05_30655 [Oerskovia sp. M15]
MAVGLSGQGVIPVVLGTPVRTTSAWSRARRPGDPARAQPRALNVLDPGEAPDAAQRLRTAGYHQAAEELLADAQGLRLNMLVALITVLRKSAQPRARRRSSRGRSRGSTSTTTASR